MPSLYQRSFGALADPLPSPLYAKLGALGDGQLSGAKLSPPPEALSIEYPRCQRKVSTEFMAAMSVLRLRGRLSCHFALKVKSAFAGAPALTVTFCVCVP